MSPIYIGDLFWQLCVDHYQEIYNTLSVQQCDPVYIGLLLGILELD